MSHEKKRILCVEDNTEIQEMLCGWLVAEGYEVTGAQTFDGALCRAQAEKFDLYLIDEWLSDGIGVELTRQIRALDADAPIVIHSADSRQAVRQRGFSAGAQAFFTKPLNLDELSLVIKYRTKGYKV